MKIVQPKKIGYRTTCSDGQSLSMYNKYKLSKESRIPEPSANYIILIPVTSFTMKIIGLTAAGSARPIRPLLV